LTRIAERGAARIVDARSVERFARRDQPRADARTRLERLAVLHCLERIRRRIADRGDAPRQERAAERLAEVLTEMRVNLDEARYHGLVRRVDHRAAARGSMHLHAGDAIAFDEDVDVAPQRLAAAVPEAAG